MQPFVEIFGGSGASLGGIGLSGGLSDRILSVEITDEAEDKSDRVSIELDDRAGFDDGAVLGMPVVGSVLTIALGYVGGPVVTFGPYLIDELTVSSPPRLISVTGRAAAMSKSYRSPRTQSYHQKTLGTIMQEVAGRNGYSAAVDPGLSGVVIRHIDQHNESDMAFATRLASMHDAVARPVAGRLVVSRRGAGKSASGLSIASVGLTEGDCTNWTFNYSAREEAGEAGGLEGSESGSTGGGVRAYWHDVRTGEKKEVTTGAEPYQELRYPFHNEAEAKAAVDAKKNESDRGKAAFSWEMVGDPTVQAESPLILAGFRPYIPALWRIKSVMHRIDGSGFTTSGDAELFEEKQQDVASNVGKTKPTDDDKIDKDAPPQNVNAPAVGGDDLIIDLPSE
ncbi:phage late control D family protein [Sinorhizobium meliloti]|uniref:phage late control D family protein n=1 Tax=Rhizobium meliloti TaxID=382 RepID=UPI001F342698|nr:contractile injection system protein, VgrG/Pvc8 family [Sinorhizobium meliloti]